MEIQSVLPLFQQNHSAEPAVVCENHGENAEKNGEPENPIDFAGAQNAAAVTTANSKNILDSISSSSNLEKSVDTESGSLLASTSVLATEMIRDEKTSLDNEISGDSRKRKSNAPYNLNATWAFYDSDTVGAFKQTPERLNLDGRAFFISVFLKLIDCRLNIGDIVTKSDGTRAVFVGVRLANREEEGVEEDRTLLYFCALPMNNIQEGYT